MGIPLTVLEDVSGTSVAGVWMSKPEIEPPFLLVEYDDGTLVDVTVLQTEEEAARLADPGAGDPQIAPLVSEVDLDGTKAHAIGRVDVPASYTAEGDVVPGTGVRRGTAKISWASGVFAVRVMSETKSVDDLLPIARAARIMAPQRQRDNVD